MHADACKHYAALIGDSFGRCCCFATTTLSYRDCVAVKVDNVADRCAMCLLAVRIAGCIARSDDDIVLLLCDVQLPRVMHPLQSVHSVGFVVTHTAVVAEAFVRPGELFSPTVPL